MLGECEADDVGVWGCGMRMIIGDEEGSGRHGFRFAIFAAPVVGAGVIFHCERGRSVHLTL